MIAPNLIRSSLKFKYRHFQDSFFRFKAENFAPIAHQVMEAVDMYSSSLQFPDYAEVLQNRKRRFVLRIKCEDQMSGLSSFVVKVWLLGDNRQRLSYYRKRYTQSRFGFGEANALLFASGRGLKVPEVYGYGGINGVFNLRKVDFLMMQDLDNHTDIEKLMQSNGRDQEECKIVLRRAVPLFIKLYESNCNHSDLNLGSILLGNDSCDDDYLVDFEFSKFHNAPSLKLLMFHAGYFIDHCSDYLTEETTDWWFRKVVEAVEIRGLPAEKHLKDHFKFYCDRRFLRRKSRMKVY